MERSRRIGLIVSGAAHLGAILWLLVGGIFFAHDLPPPVATAEVTLMSEAEFSALRAAAPTAATEAPPEPSLPEPPAAEAVPPAPEPEVVSEPAAPEAPAPEPEPDAAPDLTEITPPAPPLEEPVAAPEPTIAPAPQPKPAEIVAPDPVEAPEPAPDAAPEAVAETTPDPSAEPKPETPEEPAAPQETGEVLETEENKDQEAVASAAPSTSPRPASKPAKPKPAAATPEPAAPAAEEAPEAPAPDAVDEALAEALAGAASETPAPGTGTAPSGPPLTGGEKDALVVAVKACWNVGSLSTDALRTIVTVGVSMDQSGMPIQSSIRMIGFEGGTEASARQAFEAGRRAIIRCAKNGYPLPAEKYAQWQEIEIVFNPEKMRMK